MHIPQSTYRIMATAHSFHTPSLLKPKITDFSLFNHKPIIAYTRSRKSSVKLARLNCCKGGSTVDSELERKLQKELDMEGEIIGKWREKCRESGGLVELLECLEREAIMGEDEGKDATDYNRRAHIFDKSSRIFKALKETDCPVSKDDF